VMALMQYAMDRNGLFLLCGLVILPTGALLGIYYLTHGVFYDDESFLYTSFGNRSAEYRYRDIAVIVSDINSYGELLEQELQKAGIPCFLDYKKNMSENSFAEYLKAVLKLAEAGLHTDGVFSYMKNSLSGWEKEEVFDFENYCLALGIKGYQFEKEWKRQYRTHTELSLEKINASREKLLAEVTPLLGAFRQEHATVEDFTRALFYFLKEHGLEKRLKVKEEEFLAAGDRLRAREYAQVYRVVLELFDQLVELLGKEKITPKEYRELVETGLREAKVGLIPTGSEQIVIGDMERTRLKEIKAYYKPGSSSKNYSNYLKK